MGKTKCCETCNAFNAFKVSMQLGLKRTIYKIRKMLVKVAPIVSAHFVLVYI